MSLTDKRENQEKLQIPRLEMYVFSAGLVITGAVFTAIALLLSNPGC